MTVYQVKALRTQNNFVMDDKNKKQNVPETPEPPQRIYPIPETAKVKGKEKREPNVKDDKK
jgi:hypothetical protein